MGSTSMSADIGEVSKVAWKIYNNIGLVLNSASPFPECIYEFIHNVHHSLDIRRVDVTVVLFFALTTFLIKHYVENVCGKRFAKFAGVDKLRAKRLCESLWQLVYYTFATALDAKLNLKYGLLKNRLLVLSAYPSRASIPWDLWTYRMLQTGFYVQGFYSTYYIDSWRKDSVALLFHHGVTVMLQLLSYGSRLVWAGNLIEFLHDGNDVLMHLAKICNYVAIANKRPATEPWESCSTAFFSLFAFSWLFTRAFLYTYYVVFTTLHEGPDILLVHTPFSLTFVILLMLLFLLNIYWMILIWRIVVTHLIQKKSLCDIREENLEDIDNIPPSPSDPSLDSKKND